jgi:predicted RNA binding protein with dsRBD fold (UPF0201 family)
MTPNTIEFRKQDNTWVMHITADRRIEVNEDVEVTEAAKKVLEAMQWMLDKQKRTWVNLTNEEIGEIYRVGWANNMELARAIEAKLKEKNT